MSEIGIFASIEASEDIHVEEEAVAEDSMTSQVMKYATSSSPIGLIMGFFL